MTEKQNQIDNSEVHIHPHYNMQTNDEYGIEGIEEIEGAKKLSS